MDWAMASDFTTDRVVVLERRQGATAQGLSDTTERVIECNSRFQYTARVAQKRTESKALIDPNFVNIQTQL